MRNYCLVAFWLFCLVPLGLAAKPLAPQDAPEPLKPWVGWALHGNEQRVCPFLYDSVEAHRCAWPSRLELSLDEHSGRFTAFWQVDAESWAELPGSAELWPQQVELDGKPAAVASHDGEPALWLPPGPHRVTGRLLFEQMPESLAIPRDSGLLTLSVNGKALAPVFNEQGELWLQGMQASQREEVVNSLALRVFRRVIDEIPLRVVTRLDLEVAGQQREALLAGGLLPEAIPLRLDSPLPARMENDGRLRVLLRPGRWHIDLTTRHPGERASLALPANPAEPWPAEETWSFEARPQTRVVEISGAQTVDPRQTEMPPDWKSLPAYRLPAGQALAFKTLRRGDPDAAPDQLNLRRRLWLDFDGGGYTVRDEITGSLGRQWRLDALPGLRPGRVEVDGEPQLLTVMDGAGQAGVELRRGQVLLAADSRGEGGLSRLSATGWARDFQSVGAELNLPPGWRLLATTGVDSASDTWVGRWTLLDLFLVLVAALGLAMLRGRICGAIAAAALILLWQEPDAPKAVWLHLLAAAGLLHVLPAGRVSQAVGYYRRLAAVALAFIALPFMVDQVRQGVYPQLERQGMPRPALQAPRSAEPWPAAAPAKAGSMGRTNLPAAVPPPLPAAPAEATGVLEEQVRRMAAENEAKPSAGFKKSIIADGEDRLGAKIRADEVTQFGELDPGALTQTGPGLPDWQWRTIGLSWNGPVLASQEIGLILLPPAANLLLNLLRVASILALAWVLLRGDGMAGKFRPSGPGVKSLALALLALLALPEAKAEMPSPQLLEELKARLLAPPECQDECAQIAWLRLQFDADGFSQRLEIHAHANVAVPLPAQQGQWLPAQASVDGAPAETLFRADGVLWLGLKPGRHEVVLAGPLPAREQVQLALPLKPHRVEVEGGGWQVEGIKENGEPEDQLQLTRQLRQGQAPSEPELEARPLPPFLEVRRTLRLGLEWRVATQVARLSPADAPVVLDIPLLAGESVTTPGLQVKNGKLSVSLASGQSDMAWESSLEKTPAITLTAPSASAWTEVWRADVGPVWHLESEGIAPLRHQDAQARRLPEWRPWPGESVTLRLNRPKGAPGTTLTVESSQWRLSPGRRATDASLALALRSSQGGQHAIRLPAGAVLQSVQIDGRPQPIRQQGQTVTLPMRPGRQNFSLSWRQEAGIGPLFAAPEVDLGAPSVNSAISVELGRDRWVLLSGGPRLGPAVLFWGVLAVLALLAFGLGRLAWTPLKTRHWFLLLMGLSQVELAAGACVVGWLLALGWRGRLGAGLADRRFKAAQVGLALLSVLALLCLFYAVSNGLLGLPDMQVAGNGSNAWTLNWYQDRSPQILPQPWALSAPLWSYRALMLLWALWLAYSLLNWLRWGFGCLAAGGWWRARNAKPAS